MPISALARAFISMFSLATNQRFRFPVGFQTAQDAEQAVLIDPPITEEELRLVVRYVRQELSRNKRTPLNENSLLWHNLMPDNASKFQAYHHLAEQAVKRGELSRPKAVKAEQPANIVPMEPDCQCGGGECVRCWDRLTRLPRPAPEPHAHAPGSLLATVHKNIYRREA